MVRATAGTQKPAANFSPRRASGYVLSMAAASPAAIAATPISVLARVARPATKPAAANAAMPPVSGTAGSLTRFTVITSIASVIRPSVAPCSELDEYGRM